LVKDSQSPTYQAYTVVKREGQDDYWLNIGAAFEHADGKGFNIILQALPLNAKIVLRPPKEDREDAHREEEASRRQPARDTNDRRRARS
jgi:hypothetical protein